MEQREDVLVVKSNKENFISSGIAAVLFALMGIIFPDGRMCIFWFTMALVVLRSCVVSNQMLILSKDGMTVKRKKITKYSWDELKLKRVNSYNRYHHFKKAVLLSKYKCIQGQGISPGIYQFINPYLVFAIPIGKEPIKPEIDGSFVGQVDENVLAEKMREWHVELSGDNLGKLPGMNNLNYLVVSGRIQKVKF